METMVAVGADRFMIMCASVVCVLRGLTLGAQPRAARERAFDLALRGARLAGCSALLAGSTFARFRACAEIIHGRFTRGTIKRDDLSVGLARQLPSVPVSNAADHLDGPQFRGLHTW